MKECRLFATVARLPGWIGGVPARDWWRALLLVCWDTGERIGAVVGVRWQDVDLAGGYCRCRAETRKGHRRDRLYRLAPDTIAALKTLPRGTPEPTAAVLEWPYCRGYLWQRYARVLRAAGLPADRRSKFHRIRRTVASYCEKAGGNATELLGHSARRVTECYLDPRIAGQQTPVDYLFRPGEQPPEL